MPTRARLQAALGASADDIEAAFYDALQNGDLAQLMACWADDDDVLCIHPGGPRLVGVEAIRASYEDLLSNGGLAVRPERVQRIEGLGGCVHGVIERIEFMGPEGPQRAFVIATHVFHKTAQGWRLVLHHASAGPVVGERVATAVAPSRLH